MAKVQKNCLLLLQIKELYIALQTKLNDLTEKV